MSQTADVVIIGGGVVGAASAYFLSRAGASVVLVEQKGISAGASAHGPGFFNAFGGDFRPGSHLALALESIRLIREHQEVLGKFAEAEDWFNEKPDLAVAFDEKGKNRIQAMYNEAKPQFETSGDLGEWLTSEEVLKREPLIADSVRGGYYFPSVIQIDGLRLAHQFAAAAESFGATIVIDEAVGLEWTRSSVSGVKLKNNPSISAGAVVISMGSWTPAASVWLGYPLPICSLKGQLHVLSQPGYTLKHHVIGPVVLMQYLNGEFLLGATPDPAPGGGLLPPESYIRPLWDTDAIDEDRVMLLQKGVEMFPFLEGAKVIKDLSGLRPMSTDLLPIIGKIPVFENVYMASGHGRKGIHLSAATGALLADEIIKGASSMPFDVSPFSPARFMPEAL